MDDRMDGQIDGKQMDGPMDVCSSRLRQLTYLKAIIDQEIGVFSWISENSSWMERDGQPNGQIDGQMDGSMDGWMFVYLV